MLFIICPSSNCHVLLLAAVTGVLLLAEQLGGAVVPAEEGPSPIPPALFTDVGALVDDWEKYLRSMADNVDEQNPDTSTDISSKTRRQEDNLFLQVRCLMLKNEVMHGLSYTFELYLCLI